MRLTPVKSFYLYISQQKMREDLVLNQNNELIVQLLISWRRQGLYLSYTIHNHQTNYHGHIITRKYSSRKTTNELCKTGLVEVIFRPLAAKSMREKIIWKYPTVSIVKFSRIVKPKGNSVHQNIICTLVHHQIRTFSAPIIRQIKL